MSEKIMLSGKWELFIADCVEEEKAKKFYTREQLLKSGFKMIEGSVPGNFELDMQAAGLADDFFYADNILKAQDYENYSLWYYREFEISDFPKTEDYIVFEGIDTFADIYLNGELLATTDNMLIPYEFIVSEKLCKKNELIVHIKPTVPEAQKYEFEPCCTIFQKYNAESLSVRKAPHMYGWDIMPRVISGGLWREVYIERRPKERINEFYMYTVKANPTNAEVWAYFNLSRINDIRNYSVKITGICGESRFESTHPLWHNEGTIKMSVKEPLLWWPKNMGKTNLYRVKAELLYFEKSVDSLEFNFGIRTVRLDRTSLTDESGNGEFKFYINNEPMFVMGTNWVPLDAFHSRDAKRLDKALELLDDVGCNAVRCWGGNVYEDHTFFDFCDSHGIAVWQDFSMGCAAYPQNDDFCNRLKSETEKIVKKLRRHPSLIIWAGDNECDEAYTEWSPLTKNPAKNKLTRMIIPDVLWRLDPARPYLPSSPYVDEIAFNSGDFHLLPEKHLWGPRDYFKGDYYKNSVAHFASETGYHGCPNVESVKKFISPDKLWPFENNDEWIIHAACMERGNKCSYSYRIPLMVSQVKTLWGNVPDNLEEFSIASQISQAEADKYFIERFRMGKWRRTGVIWWNLIDGWPQFSDAVVDYYFSKKTAYYYIKRTQAPICLMLSEPENGYLRLVAANEYPKNMNIEYTVTDMTDDTVVISGKTVLPRFSSTEIGKTVFDEKALHFYYICWNIDGKQYKNHYLSGTPPYDLQTYLKYVAKADLLKD